MSGGTPFDEPPGAVVLWEPGQPLPAFGCLDGVEVAVIAKADWHELVMLRAKYATGPTLQLDPIGSAHLELPLRVTVQGTDAVLISAKVYDGHAEASKRRGLSRIERDPELKAFVDAGLATHGMPELREEAVRLFGPERAPSLSALGRYAIARRRLAERFTKPDTKRRR